MLTTIFRNRRSKLIGLTATAIVLLAALVAVSIVSGFTLDVRTAYNERNIHSTDSVDYEGLISLEEMIVDSDVIAVVSLESVSRGVEKQKRSDYSGQNSETGYTKTLEFTFEVEQYLKGAADDQIIGLVVSTAVLYNTAAGALLGKTPDKNRKTHWDDRKAVVFLHDDGKEPELNWKAGRYWLGGADENDYYSIANRYRRPWLPAVSEAADEQIFLLEQDLKIESPRTVTLDDLKGMVSLMEQKVAGQSEGYRDCVYHQYRWHRQVEHWNRDGTYWYGRDDVAIGSGLPEGTHIFTGGIAPYVVQTRLEMPLQPGQEDSYVLTGRDQEYLVGTTPGYISLARPLPQGEYKTYHAHLPYGMGAACGGVVPDAEMRREELFVTVTAPEGTLHEAFFDPVQDGKAVLAGSNIGLLEPATFTDADGASATIQSIAWEAGRADSGTVTIRTAPAGGLTDQTIDFIALDGQTRLTLKVADATVQGGVMSWNLKEQPWQAGDKLMLRIH